MLARAEAQQRLAQYKSAQYKFGHATPRTGLSGLRSVSPLAKQFQTWLDTPRGVDLDRLAEELDRQNVKQLQRLFGSSCPALAGPLARWWEWSKRAPYQLGYNRRGFRSSRPADSRINRIHQLRLLTTLARTYPQDVEWFATWFVHLNVMAPGFGGVFASEIDNGNAEVADLLTACAFGQHPIGGITTAGIAGLLGSNRPDCWESVATLLTNAGRQEGLRSVVLEAADLATPIALRRILSVVVENDLTRFAGTVRAAGVWFGEQFDVRKSGQLRQIFTDLIGYLDHLLAQATARGQLPTLTLVNPDPAQLFIGLWALALFDAHASVATASTLVSGTDPNVRRSIARLLAELALPDGHRALLPLIDDPDVRVYAAAVDAWPTHASPRDDKAALSPREMNALLHRMRTLGKPQPVEVGVLGSRITTIGSAHAADVILANCTLAAAPAEAFAVASVDGRYGAVNRLTHYPREYRAALFGFLDDASSLVRGEAFRALQTLDGITASEADQLHDALRRKAGDLRRAAITLLLRQDRKALTRSIDILSAGTIDQQRAAIELAQEGKLPTPAVISGLAAEREQGGIPANLRFTPSQRTPAQRPPAPAAGRFEPYHQGCLLAARSLRAWLSEHASTEVRGQDGSVQLLSNVRWVGKPAEGQRFVLPEVVEPWWDHIEGSLTDGGVELQLIRTAMPRLADDWATSASTTVIGRLAKEPLDSPLLWQLIASIAAAVYRPSWTRVVLDATEAVWQHLPLDGLVGLPEVVTRRGRTIKVDQFGQLRTRDARTAFLDPTAVVPFRDLDREQLSRFWRLLRFLDEPEGTIDLFDGPKVRVATPRGLYATEVTRHIDVPDQPNRARPPVEVLALAVNAGVATRADLLDALLSLETSQPVGFGWVHHRVDTLWTVTARRLPPWAATESIQSVADEVRTAAIDAELHRGDLPVPLTKAASSLRTAAGVRSAVSVLSALGSRPLTRGYSWTHSRESSLSHLARIHQPTPDDSAATVTAAFNESKIRQKRVIEYAVYAPQWAAVIEASLQWPGFESAVWWMHAHTNDDSWSVDQQIREEWTTAVAQRTPLDAVDLVRGGADVAWFADVIDELGADRFDVVLAAAKYASSAGGHKRAELFANALLGRIDEAGLVERIRSKRHQDSVRALGLLPLVGGRSDPALLRRYELLRGFVATDTTSGAQRRTSESTAVAVGLENLARTAGYGDPQRLIWAMEAEAVRDLANGPITAIEGDLTVTLTLDDRGQPSLSASRAGKPLKSIPAKDAKAPAIAELKDRASKLRQQARRMRQSLEQACVAGESFTGDELAELLQHPIIAPMLRSLVLVSDEQVIGFAADSDTVTGPDGTTRATDGSPARIAHPVDLLATGEWPQLQHAAFVGGVIQPFRQLFRELYIPTDAERDDARASRRYAGHQVEARRAGGIFTSRGWVSDFEIGFGRTFHREKITAWCSVLAAFGTAAEVEDATIEDVTFTTVGRWEPMALADVPPRVFSETMRDLDLVVSVAHAGGVDPQSTESSVQMRARLVEETADLLGLTNVEVTGHHALVTGKLAKYSVQLGSGVVHRVPGNAVCIIPVSAQHRGRIFLPFADDDPRTAEVISKVVLLARDDKIQDPTILAQLLA